ncbi:MAG: haloacid dehalogenase-like hydrolase [Oscillospiraceae bacterium]|nr:haloacid dehalogenase-like hydrolase [Oscillospiraceae bacterium]
MKRLLACFASDFAGMPPETLKAAIGASAGRTVISECIVTMEPIVPELTNAEVAAAFGADMILLNLYDTQNPLIRGLPIEGVDDPIRALKRLVGRPVGINLEPVGQGVALESIHKLPPGRLATAETFAAAQAQGVDYICLTGNPGSGVTNAAVLDAIKICKQQFSGLIIAGKMHGAGVGEETFDTAAFAAFAEAGADIILMPAPGTVPGVTESDCRDAVRLVRKTGALTLSAIGTSQESADANTVREIALSSKRAGFDIQHIGDGAQSGVAEPENLMAMSVAIRGKRHTVFRMAQSVLR